MQCDKQTNTGHCSCTYTGCSKHGHCCECIQYHRSRDELPGCLFTPSAEKTYDRSRAAFIRAYTK